MGNGGSIEVSEVLFASLHCNSCGFVDFFRIYVFFWFAFFFFFFFFFSPYFKVSYSSLQGKITFVMEKKTWILLSLITWNRLVAKFKGILFYSFI